MNTPREIQPESKEAFDLLIQSALDGKLSFLKNCTREMLKSPKSEKQILEGFLEFFLNKEELEDREYFKKMLDYSINL